MNITVPAIANVTKIIGVKLIGSILILKILRISTIKDADQIIVLDEGRIVGHGKHRDLLKNCPIYHEIASSQLSEEELDYE